MDTNQEYVRQSSLGNFLRTCLSRPKNFNDSLVVIPTEVRRLIAADLTCSLVQEHIQINTDQRRDATRQPVAAVQAPSLHLRGCGSSGRGGCLGRRLALVGAGPFLRGS